MTAIGTNVVALSEGTVKAHLGGFLRPGHLSGLHDVGEVPIREDPAAEREVRLPTIPGPRVGGFFRLPRPSPYSLQPLAGGKSGKGVGVPSELPLVVAVVSSPLEEQNVSGHAPCAGVKAGRQMRAAGGARVQGAAVLGAPGFLQPCSTLGCAPNLLPHPGQFPGPLWASFTSPTKVTPGTPDSFAKNNWHSCSTYYVPCTVLSTYHG